jgi:hypothetical protein
LNYIDNMCRFYEDLHFSSYFDMNDSFDSSCLLIIESVYITDVKIL